LLLLHSSDKETHTSSPSDRRRECILISPVYLDLDA
jgi:hypothetical protein